MLTFDDVAHAIEAEIATLDRTLDRRAEKGVEECAHYQLMNSLERLLDDLMNDSAEARRHERDLRRLVADLDDAFGTMHREVENLASHDLYDGFRALAADCAEVHRRMAGQAERVRLSRRC